MSIVIVQYYKIQLRLSNVRLQRINLLNGQNPYIASAQEPNIRANQQPNIRNAQAPYIANARQPSTYNYRSPFTYARQGQTPFTYNFRSPFTYRNPVSAQEPLLEPFWEVHEALATFAKG